MDTFALIVTIGVALGFTYTNGFHDSANAIATSVSTRALTPRAALAMAAVMNLAGAFLGSGVAKTVSEGLIATPAGRQGDGHPLRRARRRDHLEPGHLVLRPAVVVLARAVRRHGRRGARRRDGRPLVRRARQDRHPDVHLAGHRSDRRLSGDGRDPVDVPAGPTRTRPSAASGSRRPCRRPAWRSGTVSRTRRRRWASW